MELGLSEVSDAVRRSCFIFAGWGLLLLAECMCGMESELCV